MNVSRITLLSLVAILAIAAVACAPEPTPAPLPTSAPAPTLAPAPTGEPTAAPTTAPAAAPTTGAGAAKEAELTVTQNDTLGKFLADGEGNTLYLFTRDTKDTSNCYDNCAQAWPPLQSQGKPMAKDGVNSSLIGTTQRKDGSKQVTYNGWPLYYYTPDEKPGDAKGQGVNQVWWVVTPEGEAVKPAGAAAPVTISLGPGRDGEQSGKAVLTAQGAKTQVSLDIKPGAAGVAQPAHIHQGACPGVGPVKYPLTSVVDGKSTTVVDAALADLLKGDLSINVHKSAQEAAIYVACGVLTSTSAGTTSAPANVPANSSGSY